MLEGPRHYWGAVHTICCRYADQGTLELIADQPAICQILLSHTGPREEKTSHLGPMNWRTAQDLLSALCECLAGEASKKLSIYDDTLEVHRLRDGAAIGIEQCMKSDASKVGFAITAPIARLLVAALAESLAPFEPRPGLVVTSPLPLDSHCWGTEHRISWQEPDQKRLDLIANRFGWGSFDLLLRSSSGQWEGCLHIPWEAAPYLSCALELCLEEEPES